MSKPLWVFVQEQEGRVSLTQPHMYMSGGWVRVDVRDVARLKARLKDRERRIHLAIDAIPVDGDVDFDTGEQLHNYSRVSERTIQGVMSALDLRRPLSKKKRTR